MLPTEFTFSRICNAASHTVCEYWPSGKRLIKHSMILNGAPFTPPQVSSVKVLRATALKYPPTPSNIGEGPVMPRAANIAANTALREALA